MRLEDTCNGVNRSSRWSRTLRAVACLAAGLVTTVLVAWGCVVFSAHPTSNYGEIQRWPAPVASDWPLPRGMRRSSAFGCRVDVTFGARNKRLEPDLFVERGMYDQIQASAGWPCAALGAVHSRQADIRCHINDWPPIHPPISILDAPRWLGIPSMLPISPSWLATHRTIMAGLPTRPLWPGVLVNTLFYAGAIALGSYGVKALARAHRRRRDRCVECGYPHPRARCPECGAVVAPPAARAVGC